MRGNDTQRRHLIELAQSGDREALTAAIAEYRVPANGMVGDRLLPLLQAEQGQIGPFQVLLKYHPEQHDIFTSLLSSRQIATLLSQSYLEREGRRAWGYPGYPTTILDYLIRREPALPWGTLYSILDTVKDDSKALLQLMILGSTVSDPSDEDIAWTKYDYRAIKVDLWIKYIIPTLLRLQCNEITVEMLGNLRARERRDGHFIVRPLQRPKVFLKRAIESLSQQNTEESREMIRDLHTAATKPDSLIYQIVHFHRKKYDALPQERLTEAVVSAREPTKTKELLERVFAKMNNQNGGGWWQIWQRSSHGGGLADLELRAISSPK